MKFDLAKGQPFDVVELMGSLENELKLSSESWVNGFGVPEIMMLTELLLRAPQLLDDTLVSVDLLKYSAEGEEVTLPSV